MKRVLWLAVFFALVLLAGAARSHRLRDVFVEGKIYFLDPDCYSRMTRARMVSEGAAFTIRHHDFENWPQGITTHTTAPLDWLIAGLGKVLGFGFRVSGLAPASVLRTQTLDLAGAVVGPLLGMFACAVVAILWRSSWWSLAAGGLMAISPIVVHGTALGRPDHQALLIALLAVALPLELRMIESARRGSAIVAGVAWGLALWVSLYEPLVLLALALAGLWAARPAAFRERARWWGWGALAVVFGLGILIDGWRVTVPSPELREAFARWRLTIGELQSTDWTAMLRWVGAASLLAPLALAFQWRRPAARWLLCLVVATFALTWWQMRWGYFLALTLAISLPVQVEALPCRRWMGGLVLLAGLWPMAHEWDTALFDEDPDLEREQLVKRLELQTLRELSELQGARQAGPFLAPWWLSPAVSYWSRLPGVAGSSHESLPGILDTARVWLAADAGAALPILRERRVAWILADAPERLIPTSATLLGVPAPDHGLAHDLTLSVLPEPWTLALLSERALPQMPRGFFKVWRVRADAKPSTMPDK